MTQPKDFQKIGNLTKLSDNGPLKNSPTSTSTQLSKTSEITGLPPAETILESETGRLLFASGAGMKQDINTVIQKNAVPIVVLAYWKHTLSDWNPDECDAHVHNINRFNSDLLTSLLPPPVAYENMIDNLRRLDHWLEHLGNTPVQKKHLAVVLERVSAAFNARPLEAEGYATYFKHLQGMNIYQLAYVEWEVTQNHCYATLPLIAEWIEKMTEANSSLLVKRLITYGLTRRLQARLITGEINAD